MELQKEVHQVNKETAAELVQSDLSEEWWNEAMDCYCHLRNICDTLADGKTAHQKRFNALFKRALIHDNSHRPRYTNSFGHTAFPPRVSSADHDPCLDAETGSDHPENPEDC